MRQFRDVSPRLFERHGIAFYGPWFRDLKKGRQLVYVFEFEDEGDRARRWGAFREDPEWKAAQAEDEAGGPLIAGSELVELVR